MLAEERIKEECFVYGKFYGLTVGDRRVTCWAV
jgi:hypothetical protein